jgi:beta-xylosidase
MVFLGVRPQNPQNATGISQLGRETFMAPVRWDSNGWPVVNEGKPITFDMPGLYDLARPKVWRDDFSGKLADKAYYTARTPYRSLYSLTERPGYLRLRGNAYTLSDRETPAALFRKQVDFDVVWSTEVDFHPTNDRHEAGATIYLSIHYHNEVAITQRDGKRVIVVRTRSGPKADLSEKFFDAPSRGTVQLFIRARRERYEFGFGFAGQDPKYVGEVESRWLQAHLEGWQTFTGSFFGVYSTGALLPILVPAVSERVEICVQEVSMIFRTLNMCRLSCYRVIKAQVGI